MNNNRKSQIVNRQSPRAFTLIELLLVIGIILILIGILIPTVTQVRVAAQTTNTKQMISRIEAGLSSYYTDFQAYPGPFTNAQILPQTGSTAINGQSPTPANVTSSESLFLGIAGGLRLTVNASNVVTGFTYNVAQADPAKGPASLNPLAPKRYQPYVSVERYETSLGSTPRFFPASTAGRGGSADTDVPEFMDRYSSPMPILYLRANRGSNGFVSTATDTSVQYNFGHLAPYGFTTISNDFATDTARDGTGARGSYKYFGNETASSATAGVPHKKDAYILISAGPDGKYGTTDDKTNYRAN